MSFLTFTTFFVAFSFFVFAVLIALPSGNGFDPVVHDAFYKLGLLLGNVNTFLPVFELMNVLAWTFYAFASAVLFKIIRWVLSIIRGGSFG